MIMLKAQLEQFLHNIQYKLNKTRHQTHMQYFHILAGRLILHVNQHITYWASLLGNSHNYT